MADNDTDEFEFVVNERDMAFESVAALLLGVMVFLALVAFGLSERDDDSVVPPVRSSVLSPDIDGTLTTVRRP
jgi:hypothetical protein